MSSISAFHEPTSTCMLIMCGTYGCGCRLPFRLASSTSIASEPTYAIGAISRKPPRWLNWYLSTSSWIFSRTSLASLLKQSHVAHFVKDRLRNAVFNLRKLHGRYQETHCTKSATTPIQNLKKFRVFTQNLAKAKEARPPPYIHL